MMKLFKTIIYVLVIVLGVTFAALNSEEVLFKYYIGQTNLPLSVLLVGILILGVLLGLLANIFNLMKLKLKNRKLQQKLNLAEKEVSQLRLLAVKEDI